MKRAIAAVRSAGDIRREERVAAVHAGAVVWVIASLTVIGMALCLPAAQVQRGPGRLLGRREVPEQPVLGTADRVVTARHDPRRSALEQRELSDRRLDGGHDLDGRRARSDHRHLLAG